MDYYSVHIDESDTMYWRDRLYGIVTQGTRNVSLVTEWYLLGVL